MVFNVGETHSWFFNSPLTSRYPDGAIGNDVSFAHDARGLHPQRPEDSRLQHVTVKRTGHTVDQDAQRQIAEIAVTPFRPGGKARGIPVDDFEKIVLGVVFAEIESLSDSR